MDRNKYVHFSLYEYNAAQQNIAVKNIEQILFLVHSLGYYPVNQLRY